MLRGLRWGYPLDQFLTLGRERGESTGTASAPSPAVPLPYPSALVGAFAGTYVSAGMILLSSLLVGRALLLALGRREASFLEGAVGLATLILVCTVAIRLPGNEATSIACCAILLVASIVFLLVRPESVFGPSFGLAIPVGWC